MGPPLRVDINDQHEGAHLPSRETIDGDTVALSAVEGATAYELRWDEQAAMAVEGLDIAGGEARGDERLQHAAADLDSEHLAGADARGDRRVDDQLLARGEARQRLGAGTEAARSGSSSLPV